MHSSSRKRKEGSRPPLQEHDEASYPSPLQDRNISTYAVDRERIQEYGKNFLGSDRRHCGRMGGPSSSHCGGFHHLCPFRSPHGNFSGKDGQSMVSDT